MAKRFDAARPELRVLEDMIGTWDEVMTVQPVEAGAKAETRASVTKRAWSLGGKLIRSDGAWQNPTTEFLYLISYDAPAGVYRCWYFDSADAMQKDPMTGTWDAKSRTLTWTSTDAADNQTVAKHEIIDKDRHDWTDRQASDPRDALAKAHGSFPLTISARSWCSGTGVLAPRAGAKRKQPGSHFFRFFIDEHDLPRL